MFLALHHSTLAWKMQWLRGNNALYFCCHHGITSVQPTFGLQMTFSFPEGMIARDLRDMLQNFSHRTQEGEVTFFKQNMFTTQEMNVPDRVIVKTMTLSM